MKTKKIKKFLYLVLAIFIGIISWIAVDIYNNGKIIKTAAKDNYAKTLKNPIHDILTSLEEGSDPDYSELSETLKFIDGRYDTSDFRLPSLIRILYDHNEKLPLSVRSDIKQTVTNFKYWMDQPGSDSMCYWSENHQILFSSGEYLLGSYYSDDLFTNMGIKGKEHRDLGKKRVLIWLEQRFLYGFTEWYSSTYYVEDIASLSVLIDFSPDEEVRIKASMVLDLLIYDLATQNFKGTFTPNSGRMYSSAKMSGRNGSMKEAIYLIWPKFNKYLQVKNITGLDTSFKYIKNYEVPEVLKLIGYDQDVNSIIKGSTGLNITEFDSEGLIGLNDNQIMMQLSSESFTNSEIIENSIRYISKHKLFSNEFLYDFRLLNIGIVKLLNISPVISKLIEPMFNGTAIQRANTYMYRTPYYAMSTAQAYHPGMPGDQHNLYSLNMNNDFNIFVQQPASSLKEDGALGLSPNYWVGNGFHPHSVQDKNINISLWVLPDKVNKIGDLAGVARKILNYSHAFFPKQYMDKVIIHDQYAFGKVGDTYVALIANNNLKYKTFNNTDEDKKMKLTQEYDLIQEGRETFWITEVGTANEYESFDSFIQSIKGNRVKYLDQTITYKNLELKYKGNFKVDGKVINLEYNRFDSKYSQTKRKSEVIEFNFNGNKLYLDFKNNKREF